MSDLFHLKNGDSESSRVITVILLMYIPLVDDLDIYVAALSMSIANRALQLANKQQSWNKLTRLKFSVTLPYYVLMEHNSNHFLVS